MSLLTRRQWILAAALLPAGGVMARVAPPPEVAAELPGARAQGQGQLRFFGLRVYDIRLWAGDGAVAADWPALPLALEIEYARELDGAAIAERSLKEMRRQADDHRRHRRALARRDDADLPRCARRRPHHRRAPAGLGRALLRQWPSAG